MPHPGRPPLQQSKGLDVSQCQHCLNPITPRSSRGRASSYCSTRCRVAAHRSHNFVTDRRDYCPTPKDIVTEAPSAISRPLEGMLDAREIVTLLRRVRYLGRITGSRLALLVPRN